MRFTARDWSAGARLFDLEGAGLRVSVSNLGGIIRRIEVEQPGGGRLDVALGYDEPGDYLKSDTFFGAAVGPIADRLAGGRCVLDGREVRLPLNAGPDCMHCGELGFQRVLWDASPLPDGLRLRKVFPADARGFPGELAAEIRVRLLPPRTLRLEYTATCDRETAVSFTNHTYFNLSGGRRDCLNHILTLRASRYAETERDVDPICTSRALPVDGTPLDFRSGAAIGDRVGRKDYREIAAAGGVDHYFITDGAGLREQARLYNPENGLELRCRSDAPGVLVYTANGMSAERGRNGAVYGRNWGVCLETERFPNAVNFPNLRGQVLLRPGESYQSATEFEFRWKADGL